MIEILKKISELISSCDVVDLTPTMENDIPRWPTHPPLVINPTVTHTHDGYACQTLFMAEHCGAHVDAPAHQVRFMQECTIETFPANYLMGQAVTYPLYKLNAQPGQRITADQILSLEKEMGTAVEKDEILLMDFGWFDKYWTTTKDWLYYAKNEPGLTEGAVRMFAERGIRAVGSDTIACDTPVINGEELESYGHHMHWLPNKILIMEMLKNLNNLPVRSYFIATPLKIKNGSGSPIRPFALIPKE